MAKPIYQFISQLMSTMYARYIILAASLLHSTEILHNLVHIFGASLSEPHTSGSALERVFVMYLFACGHIL